MPCDSGASGVGALGPLDPRAACRAATAPRSPSRAPTPCGSGSGCPRSATRSYGLFALEKVAVFLGKETFGGVPWYAAGAEALLRLQDEDGAWRVRPWDSKNRGPAAAVTVSEPPGVATSFALLFLVRSADAFKPGPPVTPSDPVPAPAR